METNMQALFLARGTRFNAELRPDPDVKPWKAPKKLRAFVWNATDDLNAEMALGPVAKRVGAPHIHTKRGDFPELDKAWDAFNRDVVAQERLVLEAGIAALRARGLQFSTDALKMRFSRYAGCSCPCSPGFIVEGLPAGHNIFINNQDKADALEREKQQKEKEREPSFIDFYEAPTNAAQLKEQA